jgi:ABC-2 type transport system ATP-binding protein
LHRAASVGAAAAATDPERGAQEVVRAAHLRRRFGATVAVDGVSFEVRPGEMFGLIGPDGAGKTTTLKMILGLLAPDGGRVTTLGLEAARRRRRLAERAGYLSQTFSLYGDLSIDENIAFFAAVRGVRHWRRRRDELLERLRLASFRDRLADRLSGGMKQKLALACVLIHTPELLVLDEPTTGVDPVSRREFWKILSGLQQEGLTLIVATPYLDEAERCQRVALFSSGRILSLDTPQAIRGQWRGSMAEIIASPRQRAVELLREQSEVGDTEIFGERIHVSLPDVEATRAGEATERLSRRLGEAGVYVEEARAVEPTLEDVFIARIRAEDRRTAAGEDDR